MRAFAVILSACLLSSCAYMQTHKNVEEWGCRYRGGELTKEQLGLYHGNGQWYLSAPAATFKKDYPIIHDSVFRKGDNHPHHVLVKGTEEGTAYFPISAGTALVLQRTDGYAQLSSLAEEIKSRQQEPVFQLPSAQRFPIRAEIDANGKEPVNLVGKRSPESTPLVNQALSKLDFVVIDIPGTLAYNVAIPFMAPFVFFREFISGY